MIASAARWVILPKRKIFRWFSTGSLKFTGTSVGATGISVPRVDGAVEQPCHETLQAVMTVRMIRVCMT